MRIDRGHDGFKTPQKFRGIEFPVEKCPLLYADHSSVEFMRAYPLFEMGILPVAGGWLEQTAIFIDAMNVIKNQLDKMAEEKQKNGNS